MEIYLDNAATTKPVAEAVEAANEAMASVWHNPSSLYRPSVEVLSRLSAARKTVAGAAGARSLIFTSGGSEANNMAIKSFVRPGARQHFICSSIEHSSVYETMAKLREAGHSVDFIRPSADYTINPADVANAIRPDTALVSIMHVNSETGAINDIASIGMMISQRNSRTVFHSDGVQAFMKIDAHGANWASFYSVSAHKIGALKGTGALMINGALRPRPLINGGGQESELRAGTENTVGIFAFERAVRLWRENYESYASHMRALRRRFIEGLSLIDGAIINSAPEEKSAPHILNVSFIGVRGETMLHMLEEKGIYVGVGSACSSRKGPSRVLASQGLSRERLSGVLRISLCPRNTAGDVDIALEEMKRSYDNLKMYRRI